MALLQEAWSAVLAQDAENPRVADTWIPFALLIVTYWVGGLACARAFCHCHPRDFHTPTSH